MKAAALVLLLVCAPAVTAEESNPLGKVFELMSALEAKIVKEGEAEAKAFKEFFQWCDESSMNLNNDIKTGKASQEKLTAKIGEETSSIAVATSKVEELSAAISTNEGELKDATSIRTREAADFAASEKELVATVDTLDRAVSIISSEMAKKPSCPGADRPFQHVEFAPVTWRSCGCSRFHERRPSEVDCACASPGRGHRSRRPSSSDLQVTEWRDCGSS